MKLTLFSPGEDSSVDGRGCKQKLQEKEHRENSRYKILDWLNSRVSTLDGFYSESGSHLKLKKMQTRIFVEYNTIQYNTMVFFIAPFHLDHGALDKQ